MKRFLSVILSVLTVMSMLAAVGISAGALEDEETGLAYTVLDDGTVRIDGTIEDEIYPDFNIPRQIDGKDISEIGARAFADFPWIDCADLPETVTKIGEEAFAGSTVTEIWLATGNGMEISPNAFKDCYSLECIFIDPTTNIKANAFSGCDTLHTVYYIGGTQADWESNSNISGMGNSAVFEASVAVETTNFDEAPYRYVDRGDEVALYSFEHEDNLEEITTPTEIEGKPVTEIGPIAFAGFSNLKTLNISEGVKRLYDHNYFYPPVVGCDNLATINLPSTLEAVGPWAFNTCVGLSAINVSADNPNLSSVDGVLYNKDKTELIRCPYTYEGEFVIPNTVTELAGGVFLYCKNITSIVIPDSVTTLGGSVFEGTDGLTEITLPDSVQNFTGGGQFFNCANLETVKLPDGLKTIPECMFLRCAGLKEVIIPDGCEEIGEAAFADCGSLEKITVPDSVKDVALDAFDTLAENTDIEYNGTKEQWAQLNVPARQVSGTVTATDGEPKIYNVRCSVVGDNGIAELSEADVFEGAPVTVTLIPNEGYSAGVIIINNEDSVKPTGNTYTFVPTGNTELTVTFKQGEAPAEYKLGDVNRDAAIDSTDATLVLQRYAEIIDDNYDGYNKEQADVDGVNDVDSTDATLILQYFAEIIKAFPAESANA